MTFDHLFDSDQRLEMYGGTKSSWAYVSDDGSPFFGTLIRLIDLPVTAIMDTLILPVVAPLATSVGKSRILSLMTRSPTNPGMPIGAPPASLASKNSG